MKNYLVKTLFKVKNAHWHVHDRSHEQNLYENYLEMHRISLASYKKFLQGNWEFKFLGGEIEQINEAFEKTFWFIHDLWHQEPCNILYTDPDTIAIKPVNFYGEYDTFRMFNYTDPKQLTAPNQYNKKFDHFFNAGVRYFPSTMSEETWQIGTDIAKNWDHTDYNTEQIILNQMLWSQELTTEQVLEPKKAWQLFGDINYCQQWNNFPIADSAVLHLHGSRDAKSRVETMRNFEQQLLTDI